MLKEFKKTGEHFLPDQSNLYEVQVNLERYLFALPYAKDKIVLDAGTGSGMGTYLYSLVANKVFSVDYDKEAHEYAQQFPIDPRKVQFLEKNFETDLLPEHDITIALEVIEHLEHPDFFLSQLKSKELVFSVPLNSLAVSSFHKYDFKTIADVKELIGRYYEADYRIQEGKWVLGHGTRI